MPKPVRRIVTGVNAAGKSMILSDGPAPNVAESPGRWATVLWSTDTAPASNRGDRDMAPAGVHFKTPPQSRGGTVFRITEIPPEGASGGVANLSRMDPASTGVQVSEEGFRRHPRFHTTDTVDYAIVLEGEITAIMDEGETVMKQGDVLIQRGTGHAWANRGERPCRIAFILIDAEPLK